MVNLHLTNEKLVERGILILESLALVSRHMALKTLKKASMRVPVALVMLKIPVAESEAIERLRKAKCNVRRAIEGQNDEFPCIGSAWTNVPMSVATVARGLR